MKSKSGFWLHVHQLANDVEHEGATLDEQAESLAIMFESLSKPLQEIYGGNLETVIHVLTTVGLRCRIRRTEQ